MSDNPQPPTGVHIMRDGERIELTVKYLGNDHGVEEWEVDWNSATTFVHSADIFRVDSNPPNTVLWVGNHAGRMGFFNTTNSAPKVDFGRPMLSMQISDKTLVLTERPGFGFSGGFFDQSPGAITSWAVSDRES